MGTDGEGLVAGRYRVGEVIGSGGMAEVHRAYDELLCRDVALKVLRPTLTSEVDQRRFAAEMRLLAGLNDPGLVMLLDAGVEDAATGLSRRWLALELVDGPTLAQRIAAGPLDPRESASIGAGLARALAHVHAHGIVHRDVKPANVLLTAAGNPKLADFGIARLAGEQSGLTSTGHTIGTAAYLAPEQVRGLAVTGASDVYALGLVLLEALTGRRAYPGGPTESALARLQAGPVIPASLGPGWVQLLAAMTATDPEQRPGAAAAAARLSALAGAEPVAGPAPAPEATMDFVLPRPGAPVDPAPTAVRRTRARKPLHRRTVAAVAAAATLVLALEVVWIEGGADPAPSAAATTAPGAAEPTKTRPTPSATPTEPAVSAPLTRGPSGGHAARHHARTPRHAAAPRHHRARKHHATRKHHAHRGHAHGRGHGKGRRR